MNLPASLVLATRNPHKLREFSGCWRRPPSPLRRSRTGSSCRPRWGARSLPTRCPRRERRRRETGRPALADDSGIEADALSGRPGVLSARYAGPNAADEENLAKLEREAPVGSGLRYVCALAYVDPVEGREEVFFGDCRGRLSGERRGERGFGYDPVFLPGGEFEGRTMAELSDEEKDRISHRGRAVAALLAASQARNSELEPEP